MNLLLTLLSLTVALAEPKAFRGEFHALLEGSDCTQTAAMYEPRLNNVIGGRVIQTAGTPDRANHACRISFSYMAEKEATLKTDEYLFWNRDQCLLAEAQADSRALSKYGQSPLAFACDYNNDGTYKTTLYVTVVTSGEPLLREDSTRISNPTTADVQRLRSLLTSMGANNILVEGLSDKQGSVNLYYLSPKTSAKIQWGSDHDAYWTDGLDRLELYSHYPIRYTDYQDCVAEQPAMDAYFRALYSKMFRVNCVRREREDSGYNNEYMSVAYLYSNMVPRKISSGMWEQVVPLAGENSMANCQAQKQAVRAKVEVMTGKTANFLFCISVGEHATYSVVVAGLETAP